MPKKTKKVGEAVDEVAAETELEVPAVGDETEEDIRIEPPLVLRSPEPEFVKVKAHQNFRDGAFKKEFDELGYTKPQWNEGEVRLLPPRLYFKLQQRSGNQFSLVGDA